MSHRIISRQEWGFSGWNGTPRRAALSDWRYVTFHFDGAVPCLKDTGPAMMRRTHAFHKNGRGWSGVGYNYLIDAKGNVFEGRGLDYRGAHKPSGPGNNTNGIGIQLHLGGNERPTEEMKSAAAWLVAYLEKRVGRTLKRSWHNEGYPTSCPGPHVTAWVKGGLKSGSVTTPVGKPSTPTPIEKTKTVVVNSRLDRPTVRLTQRWIDKQGNFDFGKNGGFDGIPGRYTYSAWQVALAQKHKIRGIGKADGIPGFKFARGLERFLGAKVEKVPGLYPGLIRRWQEYLNREVKAGRL